MQSHFRLALATVFRISQISGLRGGAKSAENHACDTAIPRFFNTSRLFSLALTLVIASISASLASAQMQVDHEMGTVPPRKSAQALGYTLVYCGQSGQQSLPAGDYNSDLHVAGPGPCVADGKQGGGIYKYHWVFIHQGGTENPVRGWNIGCTSGQKSIRRKLWLGLAAIA